jgi:hypothetical protein
LKPIDNEMFKGPGGALVSDNLINNRFGATAADGYYQEVEVSAATLGTIRDAVEAVLQALPLSGWSRVVPSR